MKKSESPHITAALRAAFPLTVPVLFGYLFLGIAFGVLLASIGLGPAWALLMSTVIYAGSGQFVLVGLLAAPFAPLQVALMTLSVNARHLFYGLSLLERFRYLGKLKPYLIFSLTDETYAVLVSSKVPEGISRRWFYFWIAALDQGYWIAGSLIGSVAGTYIPFNSQGIEFAMTALFLVIALEQWEQARNRRPAVLGLLISALSLFIFGPQNFIVAAMIGILFCLTLFRRQFAPVPS